MNDFLNSAGIVYENEDTYIKWKLIKGDENLKEELDKNFLISSLGNFKEFDISDEKIIDINDVVDQTALRRLLFIKVLEVEDGFIHPLQKINKDEAKLIIDKYINVINNQEFPKISEIKSKNIIHQIDDYKLIDNSYKINEDINIDDKIILNNKIYKIINKNDDIYDLSLAEFDEVVDYLNISNSQEINFNEALVIDNYETVNESSIYDESIYNRVALLNETKVFEINGFRISYKLGINKIHLRISKKTKSGLNLYYDGDISNIKPRYKFEYKDKKLKNAYFKVDFNTNNDVGLSAGKYKRLYADFSELKGNDLFNSLKNVVKPRSDIVKTSFDLFTIKIPIEHVPLSHISIRLHINIYMNGKVEMNFITDHEIGFEVIDNKMRFIFENDYDTSFIANASAGANIQLIFALNSLGFTLMDLGFKGGVEASVKAILHLITSDEVISENVNVDYDILNELSEDSVDVKVCGDILFNFIFDIILNSDTTIAHKLGFYKTFHILDSDNQIIKGLKHFENGHFVDECTVKKRPNLPEHEIIAKPDKIVLEKYSLVIKSKIVNIPLISLPYGYTKNDLIITVEDENIAKVENFKIIALKAGVTKIKIATSDNKYEIYLNVLISNENFNN